ncbi:MAG: bifunctional 2-methylcitrate dehydratase/aconitate hydratase [Betaproteobacteria bacterium]|nr:bifunctional 2-methylcitrate dehydratase/aconitate hydratase [Betaproteobacteria bacterium]
MTSIQTNIRPAFDKVITDIADYVDRYRVKSDLAYETAHHCLIDSLGCGFEALAYPECTKLLGPDVPGTLVPNGARVPGTSFVLGPVEAAFNIGTLIRWVDFMDTFFGETVVHPSDAFGGILAVADWLSRTRVARGKQPLTVHDVHDAAIKAYEIMGGLALLNGLSNSFARSARVGLDHTILVKVAVTAVTTKMLGGTREEIVNAVSNAWVDGGPLVIYRRAPNTGPRKSWAAADQASRGVRLALMALKGEMGYPAALTQKTWGFYDVLFNGKPFKFQRPYGTYIIENVMFKIAYPMAFHGQTAVEVAIGLHPLVKHRLEEIKEVELWTQQSALTAVNKTGPLHNPADRDHCLQYQVAIGMIFGNLATEDYEDARAADPRIDKLRAKMVLREDSRYTRDCLDPRKRSNANAICVHFRDGTKTDRVEVEYPLGHRRRRKEGLPLLISKFEKNLARIFPGKQKKAILDVCRDRKRLAAMPVNEFFDLLSLPPALR